MAYSGNTGLTRIIKAAQYSWQGFRAAYKHEEAFRQEVWLIILAIPLALWFGENGGKALMIGSVLLLLIVELLNSAVEAVVDRTGWSVINSQDVPKIWGLLRLSIFNAILVWIFMLS